MDIKPDIETRADIERFIKAFYETVRADEVLGIIFNEVVQMDWDHHIPLITDFWETILLDNPVYTHNAMEVHYTLNRIYPLTKQHFDTWLRIFNETIDSLFSGSRTELAKKRAHSIAMLMLHKMEPGTNSKSIL